MTQAPDLTGRVAVVTGAGRGVGRAIAVGLAAHGARVALVARGAAQLEDTRRLIAAAGGEATVFPTDTTDQAEVLARLKPAVENALGPPRILVNGAGMYGPVALLKDGDPVEWMRTLMVNTAGAYLCCRAFVGGMVASGWGRIVNITSAATEHPPGPLTSAYVTSKVALNALTRGLAAEVAGTGVTANMIHPGDVKTEMWREIRDRAAALGPAGAALSTWAEWVERTGGDSPEKSADLVLHLVSDASAEVNGQFLWIEGGLQSSGDIPWAESGP